MKKLLSLSVVVLIAAMVSAQDTLPKPKMQTGDSTKMDALPKTIHPKDSSMKSNLPDTSLGSSDKMTDATSASATTRTNIPKDSALATKAIAQDKVVMKDAKMYVVMNGDSTLLADSIVLKNGTIVKKDASVKFKDGTTAKLTNGQSIVLEPAPKESDKSNTPSTDTASKTPPVAPLATVTVPPTKPIGEDKVVMKGDKVIVVKNGDSTILADNIKLKSGAVVSSTGSVTFKDGTTTKLKNGQFIALNPAENKTATKAAANATKTPTKKKGKS